MDQVTMTHPDLPGQAAKVSARAFRDVWEPRGWQLWDSGAVQLDTEPDTATDEVAEEDE